MLRKHPKQSLSQPTIPEEGPEAVEQELEHVTSVLKPKPESRVVKNLAQEAFGADRGPSQTNVKKSNSFKDEKPESPKLARAESIGERTMQKISKVIRGTSRSDSRSKKSREASLSPQGAKSTKKNESTSKEKREQFKTSSDRNAQAGN